MLDILRVNEVIVYFVYGQVFFTLGIVTAFHSHKNSRLPLARHLKWLAAFGVVHGLNEWGRIFIPIQATYLSNDAVALLQAARTLALASSFCLLLQFGAMVAFPGFGNKRSRYLLPVGALVAWLAFPVLLMLTKEMALLTALYQPVTKASARLVLGFTAGAVASFGMFRQARIMKGESWHGIAGYFRWTAICTALYAVAEGLIMNPGVGATPPLSNLLLVVNMAVIPAPVLRSIAGIGMAFGVIRVLGIFELETDRFIEEVEHKEGVRAQLLARVISAQEDERKRVARELHDETGQKLSAVIMGLGAAAKALSQGSLKGAAILQDTRDIAIETLEGIRQLILGLRPSILDDLGLAPALRRIAEELSERSSMEIRVFAEGLDERLPSEVEIVLFRILQEGMNNAARHSRAQRALLHLSRNGSDVRAVLEDDGVGFDPAHVKAHLDTGCGLGLIGMRERAALLGGEVIVDSAPGGGTRLHIRVPLRERK